MSRTIYIGNQKECDPVTGRPVRMRGITYLVQRHPVTGLTFFAVDPKTVRAVPPSGGFSERHAEGSAICSRLAYTIKQEITT